MPANRDRDLKRAVLVVPSRLLLLLLFSAVSPAGDINHLSQQIAAHNIYLHISRLLQGNLLLYFIYKKNKDIFLLFFSNPLILYEGIYERAGIVVT